MQKYPKQTKKMWTFKGFVKSKIYFHIITKYVKPGLL